jgi:TolA-binding protein
MIKKLVSLIVVLVLCSATVVLAQEKSESALSAWIKSIQQKIDQIVPKKSLALTTGVAGTRGAKEEGATKLYWKGKKGEEAVTVEELKTFKLGVDLAAKGDKDGSVKELEDFMKQYPDSALVPDAKKTLDLVKMDGAAKKEEPKEVKKDGAK